MRALESRGVTGDEDENLGGVAEAVIADGDPAHRVGGNVVEENEPQRDAAKQIETQIAFGGNDR
jgi:hypothetical protein